MLKHKEGSGSGNTSKGGDLSQSSFSVQATPNLTPLWPPLACGWPSVNRSERKPEAKQSPRVGMRAPRRAPGTRGGGRFSFSASPQSLESLQVSRELLTPAELAKFLLHFGALQWWILEQPRGLSHPPLTCWGASFILTA